MIKWTFLGILIVVLASCTTTRYRSLTRDLITTAEWGENDLKKLQFYVSDDIVLRRKVTDSKAKIVSGKIVSKDGAKYEEIIIRSGTPGTMLFSPDNERIAIGFDKDDSKSFLMFGSSDKRDGAFVLLATDWDKDGGKVTYGDKVYETGASSAYVTLLILTENEGSTEFKRKTAPGRTL
jgi:hypothetical protein